MNISLGVDLRLLFAQDWTSGIIILAQVFYAQADYRSDKGPAT